MTTPVLDVTTRARFCRPGTLVRGPLGLSASAFRSPGGSTSVGNAFDLTNREIILIHLLDQAPSRTLGTPPDTMTQAGVGRRTGISQSSASRVLKELVGEGRVEEEMMRVQGATRNKKTYWVTGDGITEAHEVIANLRVRTMIVGEERRKIADLLDVSDGTHLLPRIVSLWAEIGDIDQSSTTIPVAVPEMVRDEGPRPLPTGSVRVDGFLEFEEDATSPVSIDECHEVIKSLFTSRSRIRKRTADSLEIVIRDGGVPTLVSIIEAGGGGVHLELARDLRIYTIPSVVSVLVLGMVIYLGMPLFFGLGFLAVISLLWPRGYRARRIHGLIMAELARQRRRPGP